MVRVLERRDAPLLKREPAKERVNWPRAFARSRRDAFQQRHYVSSNRVDHSVVGRQQLRRGWRTLWERHNVQDQVE